MRRAKTNDGGRLAQHTIWDIAQRAGVSIATVSRVVNNKPYVAQETRNKVFEIIKEVGYEGKSTPLPLVNSQPRLIGLTSTSMRSGEYAEILAGVTEALHARNARPIICPIPHRHNCGMPLRERVLADTTEGALILGSTETDKELDEVYQSGFPLVIIHPYRPVNIHLPVVATSRWSATRAATDHLLALGHRRICLIVARFSQYSSQFHFDNTDSIASFQATLLASGLSPSPGQIVETERNTKEDACLATLQLLAQSEPPTAILALSDALAVGVLHAAHARGLHVPEQLSVIGFDDLESAQMTIPELTTMQQPFQEMGRIGVDMLYRLINGQKLDVTRTELSARLVIRSTTAAPPPVTRSHSSAC